MESSYEIEQLRYEPPRLLQLLRIPSDFLRGQYSTDFADVVSKEIEAKKTYKDGLVALSSFIGGFVVIWGLVLVFLMIKGKAVGCASGRAFESAAVDDNSQKGSSGSPNASEDETHSVNEEELGLGTTSFSSSLCSSDAASRFESTTSFGGYTVDASPRLEGPRAMRTRIAFFLFACSVLACVPLAMAFSFAPMKETATSFDGAFDEVGDVILQVRAALTTITTASQSAMGILSQTSTNSSIFCPNINGTRFDQRLGGNLLRLSRVLSVEYVALQSRISQNMTKVEGILETVEDASNVMETSFSRAESVIWLVPGLLLAVSIMTALATFGVILACKQESGLRLQRCMSYGVLPALTVLCLLCWILGIATTVTTAMTADFCLSGTNSASPDATIHEMLLSHGDLPNSTKHKFIGAYTSGCTGTEPALMIVALERASQDKVDEIWAHISAVDSFGRAALSEECGGSGLDELLSASRNIAKLLTKVRRALDSASDSLVCERIDPLYTATIHGTICTDFAEASAWGAVTFCVLGISMMVLITLRASWRLRIDEDKIYHDESEIAENMVVDEHEEYLRYISKYRHEWQEYNGFGSTSMKKSTSFSASEDEDDIDFDSRSGSGSLRTASVDAEDRGRHVRHVDEDETSIDSGEISFPSLDVPPTDDSSADNSHVVPMPPRILSECRRQRAYEAVHNQEVMLCPELSKPHTSSYPSGVQHSTRKFLRREAGRREEEKSEVESECVADNIDMLSANTEESTDFSSIGKNAGMNSAGLYWKNQLGVGIEVVNMLSVTDSLVVSPNSDCGITSFDLTKTPSPKRTNKATFDDLTEKVPNLQKASMQANLYSRKSIDDHESESCGSDKERNKPLHPLHSPTPGRVRTDPLPCSSKASSENSSRSKVPLPSHCLPMRPDPIKMEPANYTERPPPPPPPSAKPIMPDPSLLHRSSSRRSRSSPSPQNEKIYDETRTNVAVSSLLSGSVKTSALQAESESEKLVTFPPALSPQRSDQQKTAPPRTPVRRRSKLMDLMHKFDPHKFDPKTVVAAEDLQTI